MKALLAAAWFTQISLAIYGLQIFLRSARPLRRPQKNYAGDFFPCPRSAGECRKKVAHFPAHTETAKQFKVKTCADLEHSGRGPGLAGVGSEKSSEELSLK